MSDHRFSFNKMFKRGGPKSLFKGVRITSQVVWNLFLIFVVVGVMGVFFVGGAAAGYFVSLVSDEPVRSFEELKEDIYNYEEATEIYFANDVYLGDLPSPLERREVALDDVSQYVIDAIVATEDEYFFEHEGIVPKALFRAVYQDFSNSATQTGGSTLTQQLIKNQILTNEVTHDRKAVEILLALRLEQFFNKDEILEAYLNVVPFGRNSSGKQVAGVQSAAQGIFGVDAQDLNLPQAAYIAGLPQSPFAYTPFTSQGEVKENLDASLNRMKTVLNRMLTAEYITDEEYEEALAYDIPGAFIKPQRNSLEDYGYITDEVRSRATTILASVLMEQDGIDIDEIDDEDQVALLQRQYEEEARKSLLRDGYRIHTTINKDIYDAQQKVVEEYNGFGRDVTITETNADGEAEERVMMEQAASMLIENSTGKIISFVGGRDYNESQFNNATQAKRQTGSTMKPLLTYALGFEIGVLQPGFITPDTPFKYPSNGQDVSNFLRGQYLGMITAREALQRSQNIPAVREALKIPVEVRRQGLIDYGFEKFFRPNDPPPWDSSPLGTLEISVEANTSAFTVFANEGQHIESYMIERIETSDGEVVYLHEPEPTEVFSTQTAYLMIDMLRDVLRAPGTAADVPGNLKFSADWAGKTGTTQEAKDYWFVGFNPNVTLSTWFGYEKETVLGPDYSARTKRLWAQLANAAYDVDPELMAPSQRFEMPSGIVRQSICGISGKLPSDLCREAGFVTTDLFNAKFVPKEVDDSLARVNYVKVNGELYKALDKTPAEFTNKGVSIKEEYFSFAGGDYSQYIPDSWKNLIPDVYAPDNGKTPDPLRSLSASGSSISWNEHHEGDVVGYRVFYSSEAGASFSHVANVKWDESFSYSGKQGAYYVTAVDVAGRESAPSKEVIIGEYSDSSKEEENPDDDQEKDKKKEQDEKKKKNDDDAVREDEDEDDAPDNDPDEDQDNDDEDEDNVNENSRSGNRSNNNN
ncbi:penicillin-binding protein [Evansella caseinilytica]|uniref:Penicillin-binding protein n=1 Tax=Evansella caseinilytica TaxID=1503961 RepID=A0A1H3RS81_9BACI|nr:transglycosylase domain-containing protein [Evansella caseinilytica]SDZ28566.1 penicillin-binding protein [Evansella caseinilytica]